MNRRRFLQVSATLVAGTEAVPALAFGDDALFDMPLLRYGGENYNPRPSAVRRILMEIEMTTSILVVSEPSEVDLSLDALVEAPLVVLAGDRAFPEFSDEAREALNTYLGAGGMLFIDGSEGRADGGFDESVRREIDAILPDSPLAPLPDDHVLWRTFYIVEGPPGRVQVADDTYGAARDGRLAVIYTPNDVMGAWARDNYGNWEYEVHPGGQRQRDMAIRFGINLAMYALCLDYKEDQVHVNYLLRRRRWQVPR